MLRAGEVACLGCQAFGPLFAKCMAFRGVRGGDIAYYDVDNDVAPAS